MSGWWSAASASGARRLTNAIASGKFANVNCLRMASPSSVHPVDAFTRCSASLCESFIVISTAERSRRIMRAALHVWAARADIVQPDACGFDRVERLFLQLDGGR